MGCCCTCSRNSGCFKKFGTVWIAVCVFITAVLPAAFFVFFFAIFTAETYGHVASQITVPCLLLGCVFLIIGAVIMIFTLIKRFYALVIVLIYFIIMALFFFAFLLISAGVGDVVIDLIGMTFNSEYYFGWQEHFEKELNCCAYYTETQFPPERCRIKAENGVLSCKSIITEKYNSNFKLLFILLLLMLYIISVATVTIIIILLILNKKHKIFADDTENYEEEEEEANQQELSSGYFSNHWEESSSHTHSLPHDHSSSDEDHFVHIRINNTTIPYDPDTFSNSIGTGNVYMNSESPNAIVINRNSINPSNSTFIELSQFQTNPPS